MAVAGGNAPATVLYHTEPVKVHCYRLVFCQTGAILMDCFRWEKQRNLSRRYEKRPDHPRAGNQVE